MKREILKNLEQSCFTFKKRCIGIQDLKNILWITANNFVAVHEKNFRDFLLCSEAEIDSLEFTLNEDELNSAIDKLLDDVLERIKNC